MGNAQNGNVRVTVGDAVELASQVERDVSAVRRWIMNSEPRATRDQALAALGRLADGARRNQQGETK